MVTLAQIAGFMNKLEQLEVNLKEEDPKTKATLQLYSALACLHSLTINISVLRLRKRLQS